MELEFTPLRSKITNGNETTGVFWTRFKLPNGRTLIGYGGSDPGAYTYIFYDPEKDVGVVLLANGDDEINASVWFSRHYDILINKLLDSAKDL